MYLVLRYNCSNLPVVWFICFALMGYVTDNCFTTWKHVNDSVESMVFVSKNLRHTVQKM